jgi:hypothetical protein
MFLYKHVREVSQSDLADRLQGAAFVYIRLGLSHPPDQQVISYNWRRRFFLRERRAIEQAATAIQAVAADHDIIAEGDPRIHPEKVDNAAIADDLIVDAIDRARSRGLAEFDTKRASNATYDDMVFFERQAFLNLADAGTTTTTVTDTRRFERAVARENTPHGDIRVDRTVDRISLHRTRRISIRTSVDPYTHLETMKKTARPPDQTQLDDYEDGCQPSDWKRIRDEVLEPFHSGVDIILEEIKERRSSRTRDRCHRYHAVAVLSLAVQRRRRRVENRHVCHGQ